MKAKTLTIILTILILLTACTPATVTPPAAQQVPANPTLTPIPPTETAVPPTSTPDLFAQATAISFSGGDNIDVYLLPETNVSVKYATETGGEWMTANQGEYLNIDGLEYKWMPESQELIRVYNHWNQCEVGVDENTVEASYGSLRTPAINYNFGDFVFDMIDGEKRVTVSLREGYPEVKNAFYPTMWFGVFNEELCLVNIGDFEYQVAIGYAPSNDGEGWQKIVTPLGVLDKNTGRFTSLLIPNDEAANIYAPDLKAPIMDLSSQAGIAEGWRKRSNDDGLVKVGYFELLSFVTKGSDGVNKQNANFYARYYSIFNSVYETGLSKESIDTRRYVNIKRWNTSLSEDEYAEAMLNAISLLPSGYTDDDREGLSDFEYAQKMSPIGVPLNLEFANP